uniref:Uncharacterized protein n=1 Tax=Glossina palpalis gambiensis TaxID=67801 RepID=A0A1B0BES3_9MUSC
MTLMMTQRQIAVLTVTLYVYVYANAYALVNPPERHTVKKASVFIENIEPNNSDTVNYVCFNASTCQNMAPFDL